MGPSYNGTALRKSWTIRLQINNANLKKASMWWRWYINHIIDYKLNIVIGIGAMASVEDIVDRILAAVNAKK